MLSGVWSWVDTCVGLVDDALDRAPGKRLRDVPVAVLLLAPAFLVLGVFGVFPLFFDVYLSLFGGKYGMGAFVGLANYVEALQAPAFWNSLLITVYYAVGTIPVTMAISFLIAYGLFHIARGRGVFRTLYFLPYITSAVAAAMVWRMILNQQFGLLNAVLEWMGLSPQGWLLEPRSVLHLLTGGWVSASVGPSMALCCVIAFDIWHASGFMIVVFLAGLSAIPRELEEAARIDGAGALQVIRRVVIPLLSPTIFFLAVVSGIKSFQAFNSFYALMWKGRGPLDTTQNMTVYVYSSFYESQRWGYGAAVAALLCVAIVALTLVQWRYVGRKVHYE